MSESLRVKMILAGCVTAVALAACGGGGGGSGSGSGSGNDTPTGDTPPATTTTTPPPLTPPPAVPDTTPMAGAPGAPLATGNIARDGREWINYRRSMVGMSTLTHSSVVDKAAQAHSDYQGINNIISHDEEPGKPGFTGKDVGTRLTAAGYRFSPPSLYGEVISATNNGSGQYMAEELITAVYHRFVIFEPGFKEIGTGAATSSSGRNYFTANFTANNGYSSALSSGQVAVWPINGQTAVPSVFFSDTEQPDPVPPCDANHPPPACGLNAVGYPISVHANYGVTIAVTSFTVRPRGGAVLATRLLSNKDDPEHTGSSSAAIVPLARLASNTTYDVSFSGTVGGGTVARDWSFTTR